VTMPSPEDLDAAAGSYLAATLTVRDSAGLAVTVSREIEPIRVVVRLATHPVPMQVSVQDRVQTYAYTAPAQLTGWAGMTLTLTANPGMRQDDRFYAFHNWAHTSVIQTVVTVPASSVTYTAIYSAGSVYDVILPMISRK
jgi:hypothetical protein